MQQRERGKTVKTGVKEIRRQRRDSETKLEKKRQ